VDELSRDTTEEIIAQLGFTEEIGRLRTMLTEWVERCNSEVRPLLDWQFQGKSKYFRPLTVLSCYRALYAGPIPSARLRAAAAVEMFHNVSLIIDDILDGSSQRRGKPTLHCQFGLLPALMASGYIVADGYQTVVEERFTITLLSQLLKRLGVAECMQWRLRRQPLGVEDWLKIAGEDTGSMFEICACLGTNSGTNNESLRRFGHLLGVLYHGCDDVGDVKGLAALGGGGEEDLRDGILTLPAAFTIRDPNIRALFCKQNPTSQELAKIAQAMKARLPEAEQYLTSIADKAREEAHLYAVHPEPLLALIEHTEQLSQR
jgi:geranylgeranyl pyrophosphate synthase